MCNMDYEEMPDVCKKCEEQSCNECYFDKDGYYDSFNYCPMGCPYFMSFNDSPDCIMFETSLLIDNYASEAIRCPECMKEGK
jgi:hypothetical protein